MVLPTLSIQGHLNAFIGQSFPQKGKAAQWAVTVTTLSLLETAPSFNGVEVTVVGFFRLKS